MDQKLLLGFLDRPRTVSEVAEHFNVSLSLAESAVMKAVESGEALISSSSSTKPPTPARTGLGETLLFEPRIPQANRSQKFPRANEHKVQSPFALHRYQGLLFKGTKLVSVHKRLSGPIRLESIGKNGSRERSSSSVMSKIMLLETLREGPKTSMELRKLPGISRSIVDRLVRRGLLKPSWGPRGVGLSFEITGRGLRELKRNKAVSESVKSLSKRPLVSVRNTSVR